MKQKVLTLARTVKRKCFPLPPTPTEVRLEQLSKSCHSYIQENNIQANYKILWPTLFNQDQTWWAHDGVLILALRLRGADVIPTMCDKLQSDQCMIHSGVWQDSFEPGFEERRKKLCDLCVGYDLRFWDILNIRPLRLSSYISEGERQNIWNKVEKIFEGDWENATYNNYPIGYEVKKAVINNNLQGDIKSHWREQAADMAKHHAFNVLALFHTYQRIFSTIKPDVVMGNGGYYYQWGVVNHLCHELDLSYYRYYPIGLQPHSWNYALNSIEIVDLSPAWNSWIQQPWDENKSARAIRDLKERGLIVNKNEDPNLEQRVNQMAHDLVLKQDKPIFLLLTGVIWDANTNVKSNAFDTMYDWIYETIKWFNQNPDFQLVIRVHPAENIVPSLASSVRSRFENELKQSGISLGSNIRIIKSEQKVDTYDLMHLADVASVYMSTTGLEYSCLGKPLIAIGPVHYTRKGFTYEPKSKEEYLSFLKPLLENEKNETFINPQLTQELALKYWYLYAFHASVVTGLYESNAKNWLAIKRGIDGFAFYPKELKAEDLLPGVNPYIDYICESILKGLPIMGNDRWPPENKEENCIRKS